MKQDVNQRLSQNLKQSADINDRFKMSAQTAVSTVQPFKEKKLEEDNKSMRDLGKSFYRKH